MDEQPLDEGIPPTMCSETMGLLLGESVSDDDSVDRVHAIEVMIQSDVFFLLLPITVGERWFCNIPYLRLRCTDGPLLQTD